MDDGQGPVQWRPLTIVIMVVDTLFAAWVVWAFFKGSDCASTSSTLSTDACAVGTTIAITVILVMAASLNTVLGVLWLVTKPSEMIPVRIRDPLPVAVDVDEDEGSRSFYWVMGGLWFVIACLVLTIIVVLANR